MKNSNHLMAMRNLFILILVAASLIFTGVISGYLYFNHAITRDVKKFLDDTGAIERGFIERIPLYDDYSNPTLEQKLRTYLFPAHMDAAMKYGTGPVCHDGDIEELVASKHLVRTEAGPESLFYYYNVRDRYRVLTPVAKKGLELLAGRLQQNINSRAKLPPVKIAVSSMLRPEFYQDGLRERNANATLKTTHSSGVSFDIYFEDFYIVLPQPASSNGISGKILAPLRTRMGFLLGDSLRGQLRSVLTETLIQLQEEGVLYAILEKRQRCYHVTILGKRTTD